MTNALDGISFWKQRKARDQAFHRTASIFECQNHLVALLADKHRVLRFAKRWRIHNDDIVKRPRLSNEIRKSLGRKNALPNTSGAHRSARHPVRTFPSCQSPIRAKPFPQELRQALPNFPSRRVPSAFHFANRHRSAGPFFRNPRKALPYGWRQRYFRPDVKPPRSRRPCSATDSSSSESRRARIPVFASLSPLATQA